MESLIQNVIYTAIASVAITFIAYLWKTILNEYKIRKPWREKTILNILGDEYDSRLKLVNSNEFIPTMGQTEGPHDSTDEILISENRFNLVDRFINSEFKKSNGKKRYAILGGSGMGKSSFAISLINNYVKKYNKRNIPFNLYFLYFGNLGLNDLIKRIYEIKQKNDSIEERKDAVLILDALDENIDAIRNYIDFWERLDNAVNDFKFVIVTCRTQFFSNKNDEPNDGKTPQNNEFEKYINWTKFYISPFSEDETKRYFLNKFSTSDSNYRKALAINHLCQSLQTRPIILSFINDLLDLPTKENLTQSEIYDRIIYKWLEREAQNTKIGLNISRLYLLTKRIAMYIYSIWELNGRSYLTAEEFKNFMIFNGYETETFSFKQRSLLNRSDDGFIKFSHKSFWEFFIAVNAIENPYKAFTGSYDLSIKFIIEFNKLHLIGKTFSYINYYNPNMKYHDVSKLIEVLDEGVHKITSLAEEHNIKQTYFQILIYFEELLLQSFEAIIQHTYESTIEKVHAEKNQLTNISHALIFCNIICGITDLMAYVQNLFLSEEIQNYLNEISTIKNKICSIIKNFQRSITYQTKPYYTPQSLLVYPDVSKKILTDCLDYNYNYKSIDIGNGFSCENDILCLLNTIYEIRPGMRKICIYKESNIDDGKCLISYIADKLYQKKTISSDHNIIFKILVDDVTISYILNHKTINYTENDISECLYRILKYKQN